MYLQNELTCSYLGETLALTGVFIKVDPSLLAEFQKLELSHSLAWKSMLRQAVLDPVKGFKPIWAAACYHGYRTISLFPGVWEILAFLPICTFYDFLYSLTHDNNDDDGR